MSDDDREVRLEAAASLFDSAADELDLAGAHARKAAEHFREGDVPRAASHAWAALGHLTARTLYPTEKDLP